MVETIEKIRNKISKLLNRIAELENQIQDQKKDHEIYLENLALNIIEQKDELLVEMDALDSKLNSETQTLFQKQIQNLDATLEGFGVTPLSSPLDKLADFIKIVGTVKNKERSNGLVHQVTKIGYLKNDELLRPTHIIVVDNDQ